MNHEIEIDSPHSHFILVESDTDCVSLRPPSPRLNYHCTRHFSRRTFNAESLCAPSSSPAVQQSRSTTHQGWPQEIAMPPPRGQASSSHLTKRLQFWHLRYNTCSPTALERLAFSVTRRPADSTSDGEGHRPIACPPGAWRLTYQTATAEPAEADRR